jgi:hypothetical protein
MGIPRFTKTRRKGPKNALEQCRAEDTRIHFPETHASHDESLKHLFIPFTVCLQDINS